MKRVLVGALVLVVALAFAPLAGAQEGPIDLLSQYDIRFTGGEQASAGSGVDGGGDVNGDGNPDVIIGIASADDGLTEDAGKAAVIFGDPADPTPQSVDLTDDLGDDGFFIDGAASGDNAGGEVAMIGDVNGDDLTDVAVGATDTSNNTRAGSGSVYVVLGKATTTTVELSSLGSQGYRIDGPEASDFIGGVIGNAGDVNNDNTPDLLIGGTSVGSGGAAFVVFGKTSDTNPIDLANLGTGGFRINGEASGDVLGIEVSTAGDMDDDGKADVLIGAGGNDTNGEFAGAAYVVYGKTTSTAVELSSLDDGGFAIYGESAGDRAGNSVSRLGDMNDDGIPDLIVGTPFTDFNDREDSGSAYVIFGKDDTDTIELGSLGDGGFRLDGPNDTEGISGFANAVDGARDVNGDDIPDMIVGAWGLDIHDRNSSGSVFVIFGKQDTNNIDLEDPDPAEAFRIDGASGGNLGISVSGAGDINDDGLTDVIAGAKNEDVDGVANSGAAYIEIVGDWLDGNCANPRSGTDEADTLIGSVAGDEILGDDGADDLTGEEGDDCVKGQKGQDTANGNEGADEVKGGDGSDPSVRGGDGDDEVEGGDGADTLDGGDGEDDVLGENGADTAEGGANADTIEGNDGEDTLKGEEGQDTLKGGANADTLKGGDADDTLKGNDGGDTINGGDGNDTIEAGDGNDEINADDGEKDTIECGSGNDDVDKDNKDVLIGC
jgi:Ca2+-binding RTX toxin-like protein